MKSRVFRTVYREAYKVFIRTNRLVRIKAVTGALLTDLVSRESIPVMGANLKLIDRFRGCALALAMCQQFRQIYHNRHGDKPRSLERDFKLDGTCASCFELDRFLASTRPVLLTPWFCPPKGRTARIVYRQVCLLACSCLLTTRPALLGLHCIALLASLALGCSRLAFSR